MTVARRIKFMFAGVFFLCALAFSILHCGLLVREYSKCAADKALNVAISVANFAAESPDFVNAKNLETAKKRAGVLSIKIFQNPEQIKEKNSVSRESFSVFCARHFAKEGAKYAGVEVFVESLELDNLKHNFWKYILLWCVLSSALGYVGGAVCARWFAKRVQALRLEMSGKKAREFKFKIAELCDLQDTYNLLKKVYSDKLFRKTAEFSTSESASEFAALSAAKLFADVKYRTGAYEISTLVSGGNIDGGFFIKIDDKRFAFGRFSDVLYTACDVAQCAANAEIVKNILLKNVDLKSAYKLILETFKNICFTQVSLNLDEVQIAEFEGGEIAFQTLKNPQSLIFSTIADGRQVRFYSLFEGGFEKLKNISNLFGRNRGGIFILMEKIDEK